MTTRFDVGAAHQEFTDEVNKSPNSDDDDQNIVCDTEHLLSSKYRPVEEEYTQFDRCVCDLLHDEQRCIHLRLHFEALWIGFLSIGAIPSNQSIDRG